MIESLFNLAYLWHNSLVAESAVIAMRHDLLLIATYIGSLNLFLIALTSAAVIVFSTIFFFACVCVWHLCAIVLNRKIQK